MSSTERPPRRGRGRAPSSKGHVGEKAFHPVVIEGEGEGNGLNAAKTIGEKSGEAFVNQTTSKDR